jgi:hypothetical protein
MNIELSDLMTVCAVLDRVIKQRRLEEEQHLDRIKDKPISELEAKFITMEDWQIDELCALYHRLHNQIPLDLL